MANAIWTVKLDVVCQKSAYGRKKKNRRIKCDNLPTCSEKIHMVQRWYGYSYIATQRLWWQAVSYTLCSWQHWIFLARACGYHWNFGVLQSRELRIIHSLFVSVDQNVWEQEALGGLKVTLKRDRKNKGFNIATNVSFFFSQSPYGVENFQFPFSLNYLSCVSRLWYAVWLTFKTLIKYC